MYRVLPCHRQQTTAEHCIAAIGLNAYRHEQSCHNLIRPILLLPARLYASQGGSCCIKPIAVSHLAVDGCTLHVYCTYSYNDDWLWLSGSNVMLYVSM